MDRLEAGLYADSAFDGQESQGDGASDEQLVLGLLVE